MIPHRRQTPLVPRGRLWRLCTLLLCMMLPLWHATTAQAAADVRILIDVSGSMKETDPRNMRVTALRLLINLMPADSRAGVWTFGRHVNMLVPYGQADAAWRARATQAAAGIGANALHTDIEAALRTAGWNWLTPAAGDERHLVLLTDGLIDVAGIDISGSAAATAESRERITHEILPQLQHAGVSIHTIALSRDTDEALLRQMAAATGGSFERIDDADMLERAFLRLFEQALPTVTLALRDDQSFTVDADVAELTVLSFHAPGTPSTRLHAPDGSVYSAADTAPNMRWHREERYDLVTIARPLTGDWRIDAAPDPDNRALIVSDLALVTRPPPRQWLADTPTELTAHLSAHGRILDRNDFHHFLRVETRQHSPSGETRRTMLLDNGRDGDARAGDGLYTLALTKGLTPGQHELHVEVDGTTFQRARRHRIEVLAAPVTVDLQHNAGARELFVTPLASLITADSLRITATITNDGHFAGRHPVMRRAPNEWYLDLSAYDGPGPYELALDIEAQRHNGQALRRQQILRFGAFGVEARPAAAPTTLAPAAVPADRQAETAIEDSHDWTRIGLSVMLVNLLAGLAALLIQRWRGRTRHAAPALAPAAEQDRHDAPAPVAAPISIPEMATNTAPTTVAAASIVPENDASTLPELSEEVLAAYFTPPEKTLGNTPEPVSPSGGQESATTAAARDVGTGEASSAAQQTQSAEFLERIMNGDAAAGQKSADGGIIDDPLGGIDISDIELDFDERAPGTA